MKSAQNKINPITIGIAGASGSGKSYLAASLIDNLTTTTNIILSQDHYYRDRSDLSLEQRQQINYDHPNALEFTLLKEHILQFKNRAPIYHPVYDFSIHNRCRASVCTGPADILIVDGILIFAVPEIVSLFDHKIFVDTPLDICLVRRFRRDLLERGRSPESILQQYETTVRPMFFEFVQPSRNKADIIVNGGYDIENELAAILATIRKTI